MHASFRKTLIATAALASALMAGAAQAAPQQDNRGHTGKVDAFTDGARAGKFDTFGEGARKVDPFTDGARKVDPFTDGAHG